MLILLWRVKVSPRSSVDMPTMQALFAMPHVKALLAPGVMEGQRASYGAQILG